MTVGRSLLRFAVVAALACLVLPSCGGGGGSSSAEATPPEQPVAGPGSSAYAHAAVTAAVYGTGDTQYWLYEPATPTPASAPVVVFLHGWSAMLPAPYLDWIEHIVRRGNIVIYPRYQATVLTPPALFTGNAIASVQSALTELESGGHVAPDRSRLAAVGHSFGGVTAANVVARHATSGLPAFGALMCVESGSLGLGVYEDFSSIPAGTLTLCVAGEDDTFVGDTDSRRIFLEATSVSLGDKDYVIIRSDDHGTPALVADHDAPVAGVGGPPDALDWYGFWKWFDALSDAAFFGINRDYALGNTPAQRGMGEWGDGRPVREAVVTDAP